MLVRGRKCSRILSVSLLFILLCIIVNLIVNSPHTSRQRDNQINAADLKRAVDRELTIKLLLENSSRLHGSLLRETKYQTVPSSGARRPVPRNEHIQLPSELSLEFYGCHEFMEPDWRDNRDTPATDGVYWRMQSFDLIYCASFCSTRGYSVAGAGNNELCMCSNSVFSRKLDDRVCNFSCEALPGMSCGGYNSISVHSISSYNSSWVGESSPTSPFGACVRRYLISGSISLSFKSLTEEACIMKCDEQKFQFAGFFNYSCSCFNETGANSAHINRNIQFCLTGKCDATELHCTFGELKVFRTSRKLDSCLSISVAKKPMQFLALVSFPGSGNTWLRHMLELLSSVYTGSIYSDQELFQGGFIGENEAWASVGVFGVKTHEFSPEAINQFTASILLIRNPFDAIVAEFNRVHGGHLGLAPEAMFDTKQWEDFVLGKSRTWLNTAMMWLLHGRKVTVLYYEDLVKQPLTQLRRISDSLGLNVDLLRLLCALENREGEFKRKVSRRLGRDPFNEDMRSYINIYIQSLALYLKHRKLPPLPASYAPKLEWIA